MLAQSLLLTADVLADLLVVVVYSWTFFPQRVLHCSAMCCTLATMRCGKASSTWEIMAAFWSVLSSSRSGLVPSALFAGSMIIL